MQEDNNAKESNAFEQLKDEHILEKQRIDSFAIWPFSETSKCSKRKMAEAGWYWTGTPKEPDTATCFLCHKTLDGWEETDDPWKEHAKHAPRCLFVKLGRPEDQLTVAEFLDIFTLVLTNMNRRKWDKLIHQDFQSEAAKELKKFIH